MMVLKDNQDVERQRVVLWETVQARSNRYGSEGYGPNGICLNMSTWSA